MHSLKDLEARAEKFAALSRAALTTIHATPPSRDKVETAINLFQDAYRQANPDHKAFVGRRISWALVSPQTQAALKTILEEPGNEWLLVHKPFARLVERGPRHQIKKKHGDQPAASPEKEPETAPEKEPEKETPGEKADDAPEPMPVFVPTSPADNVKKALHALVDAIVDYVEYVRTADVPKVVIEHVHATPPAAPAVEAPCQEPPPPPPPPPRPTPPPPPRPPKYRVAIMNSYKSQLMDIVAHLNADVREKVDISDSYGKMTDLVLFIRMGTRHHYEWSRATTVVGRDNVRMTDGVLNAARLITGRVNKDPRWRQ